MQRCHNEATSLNTQPCYRSRLVTTSSSALALNELPTVPHHTLLGAHFRFHLPAFVGLPRCSTATHACHLWTGRHHHKSTNCGVLKLWVHKQRSARANYWLLQDAVPVNFFVEPTRRFRVHRTLLFVFCHVYQFQQCCGTQLCGAKLTSKR